MSHHTFLDFPQCEIFLFASLQLLAEAFEGKNQTTRVLGMRQMLKPPRKRKTLLGLRFFLNSQKRFWGVSGSFDPEPCIGEKVIDSRSGFSHRLWLLQPRGHFLGLAVLNLTKALKSLALLCLSSCRSAKTSPGGFCFPESSESSCSTLAAQAPAMTHDKSMTVYSSVGAASWEMLQPGRLVVEYFWEMAWGYYVFFLVDLKEFLTASMIACHE